MTLFSFVYGQLASRCSTVRDERETRILGYEYGIIFFFERLPKREE